MGNNIIFMGTPDFAVKSLDFLLRNDINISCVITSPDKRSGRGLKISKSEVKTYSELNNIKVLQPDNLSDPNFIKQIKKVNPILIVVVAFKKLPSILYKIPKHGAINLHASLLPDYRGAAPINWCLMNNETSTGVSIIKINEKIDYGNILMQEKVLIDQYEDDLHELKVLFDSAVNRANYQTLALNKKIQDNEEILSFVNASLSTCNSLNPKSTNKKAHDHKKSKKP